MLMKNFLIFFLYLSIADGRFVKPFLDMVRGWEKTLSLIYEVIDQWINFTQRKWLYLEGIFIGGDGKIILPDIADKFDRIDTDYIHVNIHFRFYNLSFCLCN